MRNQWNRFELSPQFAGPQARVEERNRIAERMREVDTELLAIMIRAEDETRCLVPECDGALLCSHAKDELWARYSTEAPRPRTPSELQYSDRRLRLEFPRFGGRLRDYGRKRGLGGLFELDRGFVTEGGKPATVVSIAHPLPLRLRIMIRAMAKAEPPDLQS